MNDLDEIYRSYYDDVYRYLRGLTASEQIAEELTQETFFRAMKSLKSYKGEARLSVWLCSIAKNLWYDKCRRDKKCEPLEQPELIAADERDIADALADKQLALEIHKLLHEIKEPYREIFMLRVFGQLSFKEIAEIFSKNDHWACVSYHRAKEMIQKKLKEKGL
ncbi:MAG: RNA polymerase sigma factor [Ruminococcus sp.]|nr:RNA polymerase sigma factor [Ruminococcus sp.]